ncbi:MAG: DUF4142 domain-containing protein [Gammaproteobacteria bacterium]
MIKLSHSRFSMFLAAALLLTGVPMMASAASMNKSSAQEFVTKAAATNMLEIKLGKLALQNSTNSDVQQFAHRMITDHSKLQGQLASAAKSENLTVPSALPVKLMTQYEQMSKLSGAKFDKAYADFNVKGHEQAVALYKAEAEKSDGMVSQFAKQGLPIIQEHLVLAKRMKQAVK